jgi:hypothetical protein
MKNDDLKAKIDNWLKNQGYPLEMTVAKILQDSGFSVSMGDVFIDPETGLSREIDVSASEWIVGDQCYVQLCFRIECKLSKNKPWVVFTSGTSHGFSAPHELICSDLYRRFISELLLENNWQANLSESGLFGNVTVGHGVAQVFSDGVDIPYKAIMSAVKSSSSKVEEIDNIEKGRLQGYQLGIAIPIVVFEGQLFEAYLNPDGNISLTEVEHSTLNWKSTIPRNNTVVSIVTRSGFDEFAGKMRLVKDVFTDLTNTHFATLEKMCQNALEIGV